MGQTNEFAASLLIVRETARGPAFLFQLLNADALIILSMIYRQQTGNFTWK